MRKINAQMLDAIRNGRNWNGGNTSVTFIGQNTCEVFLHGNRIAEVCFGGSTADCATFRRWPTRTTCDRLRALGIDARIIKGQPTINGEVV